MRDPEIIDIASVQPKAGLGANFDSPTYPTLRFSTKCRILGDPSPQAIEPTDPSYVNDGLRQATLTREGHRCVFCGFYSSRNEVHNVNDNHRDMQPENLRSIDSLCHGWQHLGELGNGNAVIAYVPGLRGQDVNHLQRTIMVALQSDDPGLRDDAKTLLNWLASHRDYTTEAWGTHDPRVFGDALVKLNEEAREKREVLFQNLAVIFNPDSYRQQVTTWVGESYRAFPTNQWARVYHDVMNAPA